jgi:hypothetical protein
MAAHCYELIIAHDLRILPLECRRASSICRQPTDSSIRAVALQHAPRFGGDVGTQFGGRENLHLAAELQHLEPDLAQVGHRQTQIQAAIGLFLEAAVIDYKDHFSKP